MALITAQDCAMRLPQADGNESIMAAVIAAAEDLAKGVIGYALAVTAYTEKRNIGREQDQLVLNAVPIVIDDTHTFTVQKGTTSLTTMTRNTEYHIDTDTGVLTRIDGGTFEEGRRNMTITYSAGYTATTLPAALKDAVLDIVGWRLQSTGGAGSTSEQMDGYSTNYEKLVRGVPESIAEKLQPFARVGLG